METNAQGFTKEELRKIQKEFGAIAIAAGLGWVPEEGDFYSFCFPLYEYKVADAYLDKARAFLGKENKFWMVLRKGNNNSCRANQHSSLEVAKKEAARLAAREREEFYVLEVVGKVHVPDIPCDYVEI